MTMIFTILMAVLSAILAGVIYGVMVASSQQADFWYTWLYSFVGVLCFFVLMINIAGCVGRSRIASQHK